MPRIRRVLRSLTALSTVLAIATGCTTLDLGVDGLATAATNGAQPSPVPVLQPSDNPITVDNRRFETQETRLGASQHPSILETYGGLYSDPKVERAVARIVGRLTTASPNSTETYRIFLLDSSSVNAFALPGGYLYITRGLLALADDSAELAAVIAHEMAHVTAKHGLARQRRSERTAIAERVAARVLPEARARTAAARDRLDAASFSRAQELEADQIGTAMMARAGYDPKAAVDFLRSMERYTRYQARIGEGSANRLDFLASHPAAPQRLAKLEGLAESLKGKGTVRDRDRYLAGIDGMLFGESSDEGYVRGRNFAHPRLGVTFDVPVGYTLENTSDAVLATGPDDVAVRYDMAAVGGNGDPSDYLRSGWVGGLVDSTVQPIRLAGRPGARARAFAGGYAFDVTVVRVGERFHRFLTAGPPRIGNLAQRADAVTRTFRGLTDAERAKLKPLRLVIRPNAGPSEMGGVQRAAALYEVLNGGAPSGDAKRKIVTDRAG